MEKSSFTAVNTRYSQQEAYQTPEFQDLNLDSLQYDDDDQLNVSDSVEYDWQLSGHRFIGERISRLYPNGRTAIGYRYSLAVPAS